MASVSLLDGLKHQTQLAINPPSFWKPQATYEGNSSSPEKRKNKKKRNSWVVPAVTILPPENSHMDLPCVDQFLQCPWKTHVHGDCHPVSRMKNVYKIDQNHQPDHHWWYKPSSVFKKIATYGQICKSPCSLPKDPWIPWFINVLFFCKMASTNRSSAQRLLQGRLEDHAADRLVRLSCLERWWFNGGLVVV